MVTTAFALGGKYTAVSLEALLCGPSNLQLIYYTFSLPLQIIVLSGSILMTLVIVRLRKVRMRIFALTVD